jgi:diguanylate cyclase (GGDEF)-like protein
MAGYTSVGAFGLHGTAGRLVRPGFVNRSDALTTARLAFLGVAVAAVPVLVGFLTLLGRATARDGAVLLINATLVGSLVMLRVGRLSAHRSQVERILRQQAAIDPLTGLPNRRTFLERLRAALRRGRCAVLFCDLDGFKQVNDRWGHAIGDELLTQVAVRLVASVRETDTVSRFGGDEFLVLLEGVDQPSIDGVISRIRAAFSRPFTLSTGELTLGVSIGLATGSAGSDEDLIGAADALMYEAKRAQGPVPGVRVAR